MSVFAVTPGDQDGFAPVGVDGVDHRGFSIGCGSDTLRTDACEIDNGGCSENATCTNTPGSRVCRCNHGYNGDGVTCSAILEFDVGIASSIAPFPAPGALNTQTGKLDLSVVGVDVPTDPANCQTQTAMSVAQCEFYRYLEQLDGFPTLGSLSVPATVAVDVASVAIPGNLFVFDTTSRVAMGSNDLELASSEDGSALQVVPTAGLAVGTTYLVAIRGGDNGIAATGGGQIVASVPFSLLEESSALTCGASTPPEIKTCEYYDDIKADTNLSDGEILAELTALERLRQEFTAENL